MARRLALSSVLLIPLIVLAEVHPLKDPSRRPPAAPRSGYGLQSEMGPLATTTNSNQFVQFTLEDNGKFTIGTVEGDPKRGTDDNKKLLFGHPVPSTSDTMVRVDGVAYSLHSGSSSLVTGSGDTRSVTITTASIEILERLTLVKSKGTRNRDTVEIYFRVKNLGTAAHTVSLRTQLDTQLGSNDGAPFRIPDVGEVTKDKEFDNDPVTSSPSIPTNALVFDNLADPSVIALLTFHNTGYILPDRVVLGYWPISVNSYDYTINANRDFLDNNGDGTITGSSPDSDSSAVVWWGYPDAKAFNLAPGASKEFVLLYGLGDYTFQKWHPFQIGVFGPSELEGSVQGATYLYSPSPFTVSAFFTNVAGSTVTAAQATLNLRPGFKLDAGETATKAVGFTAGTGLVAPGKTAQVDWRVLTTARHVGTQTFSVRVSANNDAIAVPRDIFLTTIAGALYGQVTDERGSPIPGASVTALAGSIPVASATTQADGTYIMPNLFRGEYTVRVSAAGRPDSYFQGLVHDATEGGSTTNPGMFQAGGQIEAFSYPNPVRQGSAQIAFYTDFPDPAEVKIFDTSGRLVKTISQPAAVAGWRAVNWPIDGVANGVYLYVVDAAGRRAQGKIAVIKWRAR